MTRNDGKDSEKLFKERLRKAHGKACFIYRLTDTNEIKGITGTGFAKAAPADFVVTFRGFMCYCEVKSKTGGASLPFAAFTPTQWAAMVQQRAAGGLYQVFVHWLDNDEWTAIDSLILLEMKDNGMKSIKRKDMSPWNVNLNTLM